MALLLLAALGVRVWFLQTHVRVLEGEGSMYARMADNLLQGRGFESILYPKVDLEHCWMQPILIAGVNLLVHHTETSVHIVSLVSGTLLALVLFLIAHRLYGGKVAWIAALMAAFHPLLIALSTTGYAEILAMFLQFAAIYWSLRLIENDGRWSWLFAGLLWGVSYLNRTECLVIPLLTVALYVLRSFVRKEQWQRWAWQSARFLAVFALAAAPYVLFFHHYTGHFRFEGKNLLNYTIGQRILAGMPPGYAGQGLDPNLNEVGPHLHTDDYVAYSPYPTKPWDLLKYFLKNANRNKSWVLQHVPTSFAFGSIFLYFLAVLGLLGAPWDEHRFFREAYLLGLYLYFIVLLLAAHIEIERYAFALIPFVLLWAALGLARLMQWIASTAANLHASPAWGNSLARLSAAGIALFLLAISFKHLEFLSDLRMGWAPHEAVKQAAAWLRSTSPGLQNTYGTDQFAYYSNNYEGIFPYTDSATALRYFHKKNPDYIYLESSFPGMTPYYDEWFEKGIPDQAAVLIYDREFPGGVHAKIYRWTHDPPKTETAPPSPHP